MERTVLYAPIEVIDQRYTGQWHRWACDTLSKLGRKYITFGSSEPREIKTGQFLDVFQTNIYRMNQLRKMIEYIEKHPDQKFTCLFLDLWGPGIEALAYIRNCADVDLKISGVFHAGSWDKTDFITQKGVRPWARHFEAALFNLLDIAWVGSVYHYEMMVREVPLFKEEAGKIKVAKFPMINGSLEWQKEKREDCVVWPHRICPEKDWPAAERIFKKVKEQWPTATIVRTKDLSLSKAQYYDLLRKSKVVLSTAHHENFGISMLEGYHLGCVPVVPKRCSYPETLPHVPGYKDEDQAVRQIVLAFENHEHCIVREFTHSPYMSFLEELP